MYIIIWLVNSSLSFYLITFQREFYNRKKQLCQARTHQFQQITVQENLFGDFAIVHLNFDLCTSPTDTFPFTYQPHNVPRMCKVVNFQRLRFDNSQSPDKYTGKPKIVSLPKNSKEGVKKRTFMFTFILRTIQKVNVTAQYIERCWPATNNNSIISILLQHEEDNF